jgi:hemerythrin superfamily protein
MIMETAVKAKTNAIDLLKADHRKVEGLFKDFEDAKGAAKKKALATKICTELMIHATIEEEIFYPACRGEVEDDKMDEAYVEHDGAKVMIAEITASEPDQEFYDAKVKVLSEEIKHHVKEEEQRDGIFAQAKKAGLDLDELGARLAARKKALAAKFSNEGLPAPETRSFTGHDLKEGRPLEAA